MNTNNSRSNFLKNTALAGLAAVNIPQIVSAAYKPAKEKKITLSNGDIVLFQGDSITDVQRKRNDANPNSPGALGTSYPFLATAEMLYRFPAKDLKCYNKGVSGNKVYQL